MTLASMNASKDVRQIFVIARNPEEDSKLPFLLRLPLEGGLVLKARDTWPRSARIYCHPFEGGWPQGAEILEETPIVSCRRRGALIDLVLDRPRLARSQLVFTETRGRATIFWQTQKAARAANPGARVPRARAAVQGLAIAIDTRERYPFRFAGRGVETEREALSAGDYAVRSADALIAAVERKAFENFRFLPLRRNARLPDATSFRASGSRGRHRGALLGALQAGAREQRLARRRACPPAGSLPRSSGHLR